MEMVMPSTYSTVGNDEMMYLEGGLRVEGSFPTLYKLHLTNADLKLVANGITLGPYAPNFMINAAFRLLRVNLGDFLKTGKGIGAVIRGARVEKAWVE